jgi:hypothetical protein
MKQTIELPLSGKWITMLYMIFLKNSNLNTSTQSVRLSGALSRNLPRRQPMLVALISQEKLVDNILRHVM